MLGSSLSQRPVSRGEIRVLYQMVLYIHGQQYFTLYVFGSSLSQRHVTLSNEMREDIVTGVTYYGTLFGLSQNVSSGKIVVQHHVRPLSGEEIRVQRDVHAPTDLSDAVVSGWVVAVPETCE